MRKLIIAVSAALAVGLIAPISSMASTPEEDREAFRKHFFERFPDVPEADFANGVYSIDQDSRIQWENMEEFPVYEEAVDEGEELFNTPFANGSTYADCLKDGGVGTRHMYPYFDELTGNVVTLESAIQSCRRANGEKELKYKKGDLAKISAYIAYTSRGNKFDIKIQNEDALAAYERGKKHYYMKRGQLNLACADCHYHSTGMKGRSEIWSPSLGHPTGMPVFRHQKWGQLGTLHRRLGGCNANIRAKAFPAQSDEYKALEYFLTYMSNGLEVNGPSSRK